VEPESRSFAESIRRLRRDAGLSQGELAARAGISERSVRNIEKGAVRRPHHDVVLKVAAAVGLDLGVLPAGDGLQIGVLGPFVVESGSQLADVGPEKQRCLLALLALRPGIPVGNDEIVDFIWGDDPPASCVNLVHTYGSRLRRALEPHGPGVRVSSVYGGYRLTANAESLDLLRFEELAGQRSYEQALDCWRGPVLSGMPAMLRQHPAALAAERRRLQVALEYADAALAEGCCDAERLHRVAEADPLHEGLHARLMLALAGDGQQAASLRVFDELRRRLDEELGVEPGEELRDAQLRVLRNEVGPTSGGVRAGGPKPAQLPADVPGFVGRAESLARLDAVVGEAAGSLAITSIVGPPGVGKTALAIQWAHHVAAQFPDGQLYANLRGYDVASPTTPIEALARFLRALGVQAEQVPVGEEEAAALYRTLLDGRKVLVVLDNASSASQVEPLLPGCASCAVVVTSRDSLAGLTAARGARRVTLDVLDPDEAHLLLAGLIGRERAAAESEGVDSLARSCGYLPLALRVVGADLDAQPHVTADAYADDLSGAVEIVSGDAVRAAFDLSYERLEPDAQTVFRLLGLVPGPDFATDAIAALAGSTPSEARRLAARLVTASLMQSLPGGRYRFHDLLRDYAASRAHDSNPGERAAALQRLYDFYLRTADSACRRLYPHEYRMTRVLESAGESAHLAMSSHKGALEWLDRERSNLRDAITASAALGVPEFSWRLVDTLRGYLWGRGCGMDMLAACEAAVGIAQAAGDNPAEASMLDVLGVAYYNLSDYARAVECHRAAQRLHVARDDRRGEANSLHHLGRSISQLGQVVEQLECHQRALRLSELERDDEGQARDLIFVGVALQSLARLEESQRAVVKALELSRRLGDPVLRARALHSFGVVRWMAGDPRGAVERQTATLEVTRSLGLTHGEAAALICLADAYIDLGQYVDAERFAGLGLTIGRKIGERRHEANALEMLAVVHERRGEFAEAASLFAQALDLVGKISFRYGRISILLGLARLERRMNQPELASEHCDAAWAELAESGLHIFEAAALVERAWTQHALGDDIDAVECAQRALEVSRQRGQRLVQARAHHVLGVVRADSDADFSDLREARRMYAEIGAPEAGEVDRLITLDTL
jgi:DNA-binding SARP family transcriptional activator/tetratricopeptide (TPR) repeat protein/DNA-binding XRE family transcriptional regulator